MPSPANQYSANYKVQNNTSTLRQVLDKLQPQANRKETWITVKLTRPEDTNDTKPSTTEE